MADGVGGSVAEPPFLLYVFDPLCGWCHAFHPRLAAFSARHPEWPVQAVAGGLFTGARRRPVRDYPYVADSMDAMTARTGVRWGDAFREAAQRGDHVMDSEAAARLFVVLRRLAPGRALEVVGALHDAVFGQAWELGDEHAVRFVAARLRLDVDRAVALWKDSASAAEAQDDFAAARGLGVTAFPSLILVEGGHGSLLAQGYADEAALEARLASRPAAPVS